MNFKTSLDALPLTVRAVYVCRSFGWVTLEQLCAVPHKVLCRRITSMKSRVEIETAVFRHLAVQIAQAHHEKDMAALARHFDLVNQLVEGGW